MPKQERRPRQRSGARTSRTTSTGAKADEIPGLNAEPADHAAGTDRGEAGSAAHGPRTARGPDGTQVPIRAGSPRIRLDGLPSTLRWAVWLLLAEALGLLAVAGVLGVDAATAPKQSVTSAVAIVVFTVLMAGLLIGFSIALGRRRRWARGPAIVLQLLLLPIGFSMTTTGLAPVGIAVIVIGLAGAATLLAPATRAALESGPP